MGGKWQGDIKQVTFMIVLLGGGKYCMLALLWILIFDFHMKLCSRQIIYLNNLSVVRLNLGGALQSCMIATYLRARSIGRLGK